MIALAVLLQFAGFALLAAAMHGAPQRLKRIVTRRRGAVVAAGWALLASSLGVTLAAGPFGLMLLSWFGLLSLTAAAILLLCTFLRASQQDRPLRRPVRRS